MASNKMVEVACECLFPNEPDGTYETKYIEAANMAVTAAIDVAWTRFDAEDEGTWPKTQFAPSGDAWVVIGDDGQIRKYTWDTDNDKYCRMDTIWAYLVKVRAYADPADLTPSWVKNETRTGQ